MATLLDLALQEAGGLRAPEKYTLSQALKNLGDLERLTLSDAEILVGRRLSNRVQWEPRLWSQTAQRAAWLLDTPGWGVLTWGAAGFPAQLREIPEAPFLLYYRGAKPDWNQMFVGMVGTRAPLEDSKKKALELSRDLALEGLVVVSGLARGIDAWCHRGALEGRGTTMAVLPCSIDTVYPLSHSLLVRQILASGGTLFSEYAPGGTVRTYQFPKRNRLISGLCRGVILVEAPASSGAHITMQWALEQSRDLFVLGSAAHPVRAAGNLKLASEGATVIYKARDVTDHWFLKEEEAAYA